jgi:6-pyruvoyltetrahydropterin/6-carboxytetrahydropterin synthase
MTYRISKEFAFSASHQLEGLPPEHQCSRLHGHNYVLVVRLEADDLDRTGFVIDYGELSPVKKWIDDTLDHRHLNDLLPFNPTAENMARHTADIVRNLLSLTPNIKVSIAISETPKTWAEWSQ